MSAGAQPTLSARLRWSIIGLLCIGMAFSYFDRVRLSVALASPDFVKSFHLNDYDRGVLNSAFFWSYALLQIPAGWVVDRYGVKGPFAVGFLLWSIISSATAWARSLTQLLILRVLLGIGESVVTPAGMR
jgi:MFS family permease